MKIKLDVDCTAEEARRFLGLPDVRPLQEALLNEVQQQMSANIKAMDPKTMVETWLPATLKGFEQLQQMFMAQMAGGGRQEEINLIRHCMSICADAPVAPGPTLSRGDGDLRSP